MNLTVAPGDVTLVLHVLVLSNAVAGWSHSLRVTIEVLYEVWRVHWRVDMDEIVSHLGLSRSAGLVIESGWTAGLGVVIMTLCW